MEAHYGIDHDRLVVWIDDRALGEHETAGSLCRRHADALTVPRGWSREDLRDDHPVLFRVPEQDLPASRTGERPSRRRPVQHLATAPSLFDAVPAGHDRVPEATGSTDTGNATADAPPPAPEIAARAAAEDAETVAMPWSPRLSGRAEDIFDGSDGMERPVLGRLLGRAELVGRRRRAGARRVGDAVQVLVRPNLCVALPL